VTGTAGPSLTVSLPALTRLVDIATVAGAAIMSHYGQTGARLKADGSPVTEADLEAHHIICDALALWDPSVPVVSEESGVPPWAERETWRRFWLVDPLDGTKEFLKGNGEFTVNIALIDDGRPVMGVVVAPALGRTYSAGSGLGSWRRSGDGPAERLQTTPPDPVRPLRVVGSRSHGSDADLALLGDARVSARVFMGSSMKFCCLADGTADVYPRSGPIMEWDVAAGDCVFRYAGAPEPRFSPLRYNGLDMRLVGFVVGLL
jgi:3'(2'), 5'-bisphosphate nucleotidase